MKSSAIQHQGCAYQASGPLVAEDIFLYKGAWAGQSSPFHTNLLDQF